MVFQLKNHKISVISFLVVFSLCSGDTRAARTRGHNPRRAFGGQVASSLDWFWEEAQGIVGRLWYLHHILGDSLGP